MLCLHLPCLKCILEWVCEICVHQGTKQSAGSSAPALNCLHTDTDRQTDTQCCLSASLRASSSPRHCCEQTPHHSHVKREECLLVIYCSTDSVGVRRDMQISVCLHLACRLRALCHWKEVSTICIHCMGSLGRKALAFLCSAC